MAATPLQSCSGLPGLRFFHALLAFWYTFVGSGSAVKVIQTPSIVNGSTGKNIAFHCSVDGTDYNFYWYRQLPGKVELEVVGFFYTYSKNIEAFPEKLRDRLKAERSMSTYPPKWEMHLELLNLQASDTGFYLCAVVYTVKEKEIVAAFVGSGSAQNVIQTPSFVNSLVGANANFYCTVDKGYNFFWYRQLPAKTELEVLGSLYSHSTTLEDIPNDLKDRLNGRISDNSDASRRKMKLNLSNLQAKDKGFYLCAGVYTVKERGTAAGAKLNIRMKSALYFFQFMSIFYLTSY